MNISSYVYCADNPVKFVVPDGKRIIFRIGNMSFQYSKGNFWVMKDGKMTNQRYDPSKMSVSKTMYGVLSSYRKIENSDSKELKDMLHFLENLSEEHSIMEGNDGKSSVGADYEQVFQQKGYKYVNGKELRTNTEYDFSKEALSGDDFKKVGNSIFVTTIHEMRHQFDHEKNNLSDNISGNSNQYRNPVEIRAVYLENIGRKIDGLKPRTSYNGEIDKNMLLNPPHNIMP